MELLSPPSDERVQPGLVESDGAATQNFQWAAGGPGVGRVSATATARPRAPGASPSQENLRAEPMGGGGPVENGRHAATQHFQWAASGPGVGRVSATATARPRAPGASPSQEDLRAEPMRSGGPVENDRHRRQTSPPVSGLRAGSYADALGGQRNSAPNRATEQTLLASPAAFHRRTASSNPAYPPRGLVHHRPRHRPLCRSECAAARQCRRHNLLWRARATPRRARRGPVPHNQHPRRRRRALWGHPRRPTTTTAPAAATSARLDPRPPSSTAAPPRPRQTRARPHTPQPQPHGRVQR